MEDIFISRVPRFVDGDGKHITIEVIKDWIEALVMQAIDDRYAQRTLHISLKQHLHFLHV